MTPISRETLRDYLHEALPDAEQATVEKALRESPDLQELFKTVRDEADRGEHSLGAIWRRERLSCPTREQLGGHLLQAIDPELSDYVDFHLTTVGCPICQANLDDLKKRQADADAGTTKRRQRIVKQSAAALPKRGR